MKNYRFDGTRKFSIKSFDCGDTGEFKGRHEAIGEFIDNLEKINEYQQRLFAEQKEGIIFVFQAMDAAGKDGAIRAVLSCLSPQGVSEHSFKVPSAEESNHDYLWRFWKAVPGKGSISIFNRSYYEDVLVQKVHRLYEKNKFADRIEMDSIIDKRYEQIRNFEKYLWENSIRVVKIFLNVDKKEQGRRFIARIDTPKKNWKFSSGDIDERAYWDDYMEAYETCINRTARKDAPWYVVPADHKWYARLVISRIVLDELKNMNPQWPVLGEEQMAKLKAYRAVLETETGELEDDNDKQGEKLKPSDIAVGIALKKDRQALSGKQFRKLLKKSVYENFCERFGVSLQTQEMLGQIYLNMEEAEAKAEDDDLAAVNHLYQEKKSELEHALEGCGKETIRLFKSYKKASKEQIEILTDEINRGYSQYEENLKQYMAEYEIAVGTEGESVDDALTEYTAKLQDAFEAHRLSLSDCRSQIKGRLVEIANEYLNIARSFHKIKETAAESDAEAVVEAEPSTDDDPQQTECGMEPADQD